METGHCDFFEVVSIFPPLVRVKKNRSKRQRSFSLRSYCKGYNEGVSPRRNFSYGLIPLVIITLRFAIALDEIRTRRILREKADCKKSIIKHT